MTANNTVLSILADSSFTCGIGGTVDPMTAHNGGSVSVGISRLPARRHHLFSLGAGRRVRPCGHRQERGWWKGQHHLRATQAIPVADALMTLAALIFMGMESPTINS